MKNIEIDIPKGFVKDEAKSTKEKLVLKYVEEPQEIKEINTLEDAIAYIGEGDEDVITYRRKISVEIGGHDLRYTELVIIIKASNKLANGGKIWIPDWDSSNEKKWWVYWKMGSGFGVSDTNYGDWGTTTNIGSRLCFLTQELSLSTANKFIEKFKEFQTIQK